MLLLFGVSSFSICSGKAVAQTKEGAPGRLTTKELAAPKVLRILQRAGKLRSVGIIDAHRINGFFAARDATPFRSELADIEADIGKDLWSLFFKQSQIYAGGLLSTQPLVGFYNPFVDFWLMTRWDNEAASAVMTDMYLMPGSFIRDEKRRRKGLIGQTPDWLHAITNASDVQPMTLRDALQEITALSVAGFISTFPENLNTPPKDLFLDTSRQLVDGVFVHRLAGIFRQITSFSLSDSTRPAYAEMLTALAEDDRERLQKLHGGDTALVALDVVMQMPKALRTKLQPLLVIQAGDTFITLSGRLDTARWMLIGMFKARGDRVVLDAISYYDLYARVHSK